MNKWMTKRNVLIVSTLYILLLAVIFAFSSKCYDNDWCHSNLSSILNVAPAVFLPLLSVFIMSIITYKMREEMFNSWVKFASWFTPLSFIVIFITPENFSGSILVPFQGLLAILCAIILLIASLILIAYKSYKLRGK